jgi:hypothetical protein
MVRSATVLLALLLDLGSTAHAQTLRGRVLEEESRAPVAGALIEVRNAAGALIGSTNADTAAAFLMRLRNPGRYYVQVSHPAYAAAPPQMVALGRDDAIVVELRLGLAALPLRPIIVTSVRDPRLAGFHERMRTAPAGQFLTRAEIDARPGARTSDLLREMHGVDVVNVSRSARRPAVNVIRVRGGAGFCSPTIYIDGLFLRDVPDSSIDDFLKPEMLEGAEVYTSAANTPSTLQPRSNCGVVAFWTRPVEEVEKMNWRRLAMALGAVATLGLLIVISQ